MAYRLYLSDDDIRTIHFSGNRYGWSDALMRIGIEAGPNELEEWQAWEWMEAAEDDGRPGEYPVFPLLMPGCPLMEKLSRLYESII